MDITITEGHFINDVLKLFDKLTAQLVSESYHSLVSGVFTSQMLAGILALYILYTLYHANSGNGSLEDVFKHVFKVVTVFLIATNWDVFNILIYNVVTNEPMHISKVILENLSVGLGDVSLNDVYKSGVEITMGILNSMPFSIRGIVVSLFAALLVCLGTFFFIAAGLFLIILSKIMMAVCLAVAPYFIFMYLFHGSRGLTQSWGQKILNYAMVPMFVSVVLFLFLTTAEVILAPMKAQGAAFADASGPSFPGCLMFLIMGVMSSYIMMLIPSATAALTSSMSMGSFSSVGGHAKGLGAGARGAYDKAKEGGARAQKAAVSARDGYRERQAQIQRDIQARKPKYKCPYTGKVR